MKDVNGKQKEDFGFNVPVSKEEVDWEEYWRLIGADTSPKAV